jgi:hypothetical protein
MQNPWIDLPTTAPYVLESDRAAIDNYNNSLNEGMLTRIHLDQFPVPFLGAPDAPVVLLGLNPGYDENDTANEHLIETAVRYNLSHQKQEYPFYLLDPANNFTGGHHWWTQKLRPLITDCGDKQVANKVLCVEYFPYHSNRAAGFHKTYSVASQGYSFDLVRQAIEREAIILIMRSRTIWEGTIPELTGYQNLCVLNNPQNVTVSRRNCPTAYDNIVARIRED